MTGASPCAGGVARVPAEMATRAVPTRRGEARREEHEELIRAITAPKAVVRQRVELGAPSPHGIDVRDGHNVDGGGVRRVALFERIDKFGRFARCGRERESAPASSTRQLTSSIAKPGWPERTSVPFHGFTANVIPCPCRSTSKTDGLETRLGDPR